MTVVSTRAPKAPPRALVRSFWLIHRAIHTLTGGRFGTWRPKSGKRFGTVRLVTIGRRSGKRRIAMVGYFEDGPNLVTLAMNGWGDSDPSWWLNLQASPETTVTLADGLRHVRARAAHGEERERLWHKFRDYPGWGDDISALAARRPRQTAVVVLEPREGVSRRP